MAAARVKGSRRSSKGVQRLPPTWAVSAHTRPEPPERRCTCDGPLSERSRRAADTGLDGRPVVYRYLPSHTGACRYLPLYAVTYPGGSMVAVSPEHMASLAVKALMLAGQRGIVVGGAAKLCADMLTQDELKAYAAAVRRGGGWRTPGAMRYAGNFLLPMEDAPLRAARALPPFILPGKPHAPREGTRSPPPPPRRCQPPPGPSLPLPARCRPLCFA